MWINTGNIIIVGSVRGKGWDPSHAFNHQVWVLFFLFFIFYTSILKKGYLMCTFMSKQPMVFFVLFFVLCSPRCLIQKHSSNTLKASTRSPLCPQNQKEWRHKCFSLLESYHGYKMDYSEGCTNSLSMSERKDVIMIRQFPHFSQLVFEQVLSIYGGGGGCCCMNNLSGE